MITVGRTMLRMGAVELNSQVRVTSTSYTSPTTTSTVWKNSAKNTRFFLSPKGQFELHLDFFKMK